MCRSKGRGKTRLSLIVNRSFGIADNWAQRRGTRGAVNTFRDLRGKDAKEPGVGTWQDLDLLRSRTSKPGPDVGDADKSATYRIDASR